MRLKPRIFSKPQLTHPLARGLVGYWLHNEGSGLIANDLSGHGNYGAITGPTWMGDGLDFDGSTHKIVGPVFPKLAFLGDVTFIIRFKLNQIDKLMTIFGMVGPTPSDVEANNALYSLSITTEEKLLYFWEQGAGVNVSATSNGITLVADRWYTVACVRSGDGTAVRFYVDGVQDGSDFTGLTKATGGSNSQLQWANFSTTQNIQMFNGQVAYTILYNRALSAGEILQLFRRQYILFDRSHLPLWQSGAAAPSPGQVIFITKAERDAAAKAALPLMWACQGSNNRRDFMKHTGLAVLGL